jgi:hypothetical protein
MMTTSGSLEFISYNDYTSSSSNFGFYQSSSKPDSNIEILKNNFIMLEDISSFLEQKNLHKPVKK